MACDFPADYTALNCRCNAENVNASVAHVAFLDLDYIRRHVPIKAVAEQLDLRVAGNMVHCWRLGNHQHGDRTASVGLQKRRNIAMCFVCDPKPLSPIDLVMSVRRLDFRAALRWITSRYSVPDATKWKHIQRQERWPERYLVGTGRALEMLIRSGIWASLTPAQRSIVPVLDTFADPQTQKVTISYRGIMRYGGVRGQSTVAVALKRFRALKFLRVETRRDGDGFRTCNQYRLSFDDPAFLQFVSECSQKHQEETRRERELRQDVRRRRRSVPLLPVNPLSNGWSAVEFDAPATCSVNQTVEAALGFLHEGKQDCRTHGTHTEWWERSPGSGYWVCGKCHPLP